MRTVSVSHFFSIPRFLSAIFLLSLLVSPFAHAVEDEFPVEVSPPWLKVGTYVAYKVFVEFPGPEYATLRWECISLEGNVAVLNLSHTARIAQPYMTPILPGFAIMRVLTDTRELIDSNGTVIEKTFLWIPTFMKKDQKIVLEGKPPNETIGMIYSEGESCVKTCQGYQEVTRIKIQEKVWGLLFDRNTGIMTMGPLPSSIIKALGVQEYIKIASTIEDTNVDLGPQFLRAVILMTLWDNLPIIIIVVVLVTALLLVRRRRKRRQKRNSSKA